MLSLIVAPLLYGFTDRENFDWPEEKAMAALDIYGVSKGFHQNGQPKSRASRAAGSTPDLIRGLPVLHNIDLSIDEDEFVWIVGRSGSGKTTLISLIAGLLQPDEGQVLLEGTPINGPGPDRRRVR